MTTIYTFFSHLAPLLIESAQFLIQIIVLSVLIYLLLTYIKGTRAARILMGIVLATVIGWVLSSLLGLEVIHWLLSQVPTLMAFAMIIIFQPELRRLFAEIGVNPQRFLRENIDEPETVGALLDAAFFLSERRIGALIALERHIGMRAYAETGVRIHAPVSSELLVTIFYPNTPLHDGAVIIKNGSIIAASCFFPLTQSTDLAHSLGTRHRAAIGITEETDAVVIIVSEETGDVSLARRGLLVRKISRDRLRRHLTNYLVKQDKKSKGGGKERGKIRNSAVHNTRPRLKEERG